jgi:hypothetical protein
LCYLAYFSALFILYSFLRLTIYFTLLNKTLVLLQTE